MNQRSVSVREIQRNYRKLIERAVRTKAPVYLAARSKSEAVLLDIDTFEAIERAARRRTRTWKEMKQTLNRIRKGGKKAVNLAKYIHEDRRAHENPFQS